MRVVCLDVGERRIGVAITDALDLTAQGVETIWCAGLERDCARVLEICRQYQTSRVLLGLPRNMDGTEGARAQKCRKLADTLKAIVPIPVELWDERSTTVTAASILTENGTFGKKRKQVLDSVAAVVILESYMAYRHNLQKSQS